MRRFQDLGAFYADGSREALVRVERDPCEGQYSFDDETGVRTMAKADLGRWVAASAIELASSYEDMLRSSPTSKVGRVQ